MLVNNNLSVPSLFNELLNWNNWMSPAWNAETAATPKMNVIESSNAYQLELMVPGLKKEDLNLWINADGMLVIEMNHQEQKEQKNEECKYLRREFGSIQFKKTIAMPNHVKRDQICAKVEDGILRVTLPKVTEEEKRQLQQTIMIE